MNTKRVVPISMAVALLLLTTAAYAGSLSPSASPAATSYTLTNIYPRLTTNAMATEGSHAFAPSGAPAGTLYTLKQIYQAIPTINAAKVLSGTTYHLGNYDPHIVPDAYSTKGLKK